jgi:hypothetical protein
VSIVAFVSSSSVDGHAVAMHATMTQAMSIKVWQIVVGVVVRQRSSLGDVLGFSFHRLRRRCQHRRQDVTFKVAVLVVAVGPSSSLSS